MSAGRGSSCLTPSGTWSFPERFASKGLLTESDPARLRIGQAMEVVAIEHGGVRTYAFAPTEPGA